REGRLAAFYVASQPVEETIIRDLLAGLIPEWAIPKDFCPVDALPLTVSGKVDRTALCARALPARPQASTGQPTERESLLMEVCRTVAGRPDVALDARFSECGGDSLTAIQAAGRLRKHGWVLPVTMLLSPRSLRQLAEALT